MIIFKNAFSKAHKKVLSKTNNTFFNVGNFLETLKNWILNFKSVINYYHISKLQVFKITRNFVKNLNVALTFCFLQSRKWLTGSKMKSFWSLLYFSYDYVSNNGYYGRTKSLILTLSLREYVKNTKVTNRTSVGA